MKSKPTYEELEKRVEELEKIFSMSLDMICTADINTSTFLQINPAFIETLGFSEDELLNSPFTDFIHPEDIDSTISIIEKQLQAGKKVINFNNRYRCKDGSYRWLSWVSHPMPEKGITYAVARDITQLKQKEEELMESKALLDTTGRMAKVGGWELDLETLEVNWTDETYRIHETPVGYRPKLQEAITFFHPKDRPRLEKAIQHALDHGDPYDMELRFITAKEKKLWTRTKCEPELVNGKVVKLKGTFQDITELKMAEKQVVELKRRNQALLDHSPVCHKIVTLDFNLEYMSASGFRMLKIDNTVDVYGKPYPFAFFPSDFRNEMIQNLKQVKKTGRTITIEALAKDSKGNDIWLESALIPVFDDNGNIEYLTVVSADTTQRKKDEKKKERLESQLLQAQKMESVGRLAGGVAHDFNNMLGVILGHTELALLQADENHHLYSDLIEIQTAAKRSADVTKQLLAFARKEIISPRQLDVNDTVGKMLTMLRRLIGEDIDLVWQPADHLWPVKMDPSQIDQILANLCVNARDSIDGVGKLTIETGKKTFDEQYCSEHLGFIPGDFVLLAVSDNGCGMDKNILENLFEPFFTTKEMEKGTGLGLATVYGIVKQNKGFINVYSETGQGSTFRIYLPRLCSNEDSDKTVSEKKAVAGGSETILLVEDEPAILRMTRMMIEKKGYTVLTAATPGEAMEKAKRHSGAIDLLMTDVVMPEMNGRDLSRQITALYPDIRLLFMSGYTANVIAHQGILDKGTAFIQKPFSMADLAEKLRKVLNTHGSV